MREWAMREQAMRKLGRAGQAWSFGKVSAWVSAGMLAVTLGGSAAAAQGTSAMVKDDLFNGVEKFAKGASDVTEVTMDPDMLGMVSGDNAKRAHSMVLNVVRTYEYDKPGMYNMADVEQIRQRLNTGDWQCSVHTMDSKRGESTDICSKHRTDGLMEQAIITVEPKELTFIHTIKRGNGNEGHGGPNAGESLLFAPEIPGLSGWDPAAQARFASMGPVMAAKFAAMGPIMEAKFAPMGPDFEALWANSGSMGNGSSGSMGNGSYRHTSPEHGADVLPTPPTPPQPPSVPARPQE